MRDKWLIMLMIDKLRVCRLHTANSAAQSLGAAGNRTQGAATTRATKPARTAGW